MVNSNGVGYSLTTWLSASNLSMLTLVQIRTEILEPCLHDGPITLHIANFNLNNIQINNALIVATIQAKILKLGFKQICASIFQQL